MKKFVSVLLVFASVAAMFSVGSFAADTETLSGILGSIDSGLNAFLVECDAFFESIVKTIIDFVVTVMDTFTF